MTTPAGRLRAKQMREVGDTARELAKLVEHPSWPELRKQAEKRIEGYRTKLAVSLTAGGIDAKPVDQRELDYIRGFLRGVISVLDTPDRAIAALEKLLADEERREGNG